MVAYPADIGGGLVYRQVQSVYNPDDTTLIKGLTMSDATFTTIIDDAKKVITNPVGFYREMAKTGGFAAPIIFVIVMAVIAGLIIAVLSLFGANMTTGMAIGFAAIVIMPVFMLIGSFIGAAILFVIWKLMGSEASYETAYRCVAYASAILPITVLLGVIPYIGTLIKVAWSIYLMYIASIEVHAINAKTAMMVFGILGVLLLLINLGSERAARRIQWTTGKSRHAA